MRKREKAQNGVGAEALAELEAIDASLRAEAVGEEHVALAALTSSLTAARPRPREEFARALDGRAAEGFSSRKRRSLGSGHLSSSAAQRRFAFAALALLAAAIVVPIAALSIHGVRGGSANSSGAAHAPTSKASVPLASSARAAPSAAASGAPGASTQGEAGAPAAPAARMVEETASLDIGVAPGSVQSTAQRVFTLASAFHGFVQQSNVSAGSGEQGGASFELRLPSTSVSTAIAALARLGHVRSENETTSDVTETHTSLERALGDARAERASLLARLAHALEPQQVESLKGQLNAVETRIAQLESSLRALAARVDFTNIALSLTPERQSAVSAGGLTPGGALHDAGGILGAGLAILVLVAAVVLPLAVLGTAASLGLAGARRRVREQTLDAS